MIFLALLLITIEEYDQTSIGGIHTYRANFGMKC